MNVEETLAARVRVHAALADATRLRIVDTLALGDASSSDLGASLGAASNLLAHHLKTLESAGLVVRQRSEGDARRSYWRLAPEALDLAAPPHLASPDRLLFVCTANSARSHLAAALWARASAVPVASAGTHPADGIAPGAAAAAERHGVPLPTDASPRLLGETRRAGDLVVTVCDRAHEELAAAESLHWSVPDPVGPGDDAAFDRAFDLLAARVAILAPALT